METSVNLLAVFAAAIASFVLGWLWYGPVFGKMWQGLMGFTTDSMQSMKMTSTKAMVLGFVTQVVTAYVLAVLLGTFGAITLGESMKLACWIWLGFLATTTLGAYLWEGKSFKLFLLNAGHQFVSIHLMAGVLFYMV